jgi:uncharacterized membrane protein
MLGPQIHRALAQATGQDIARHARRVSPPRSTVHATVPAVTIALAVLLLALLGALVSA